jgi:hypothetical protein
MWFGCAVAVGVPMAVAMSVMVVVWNHAEMLYYNIANVYQRFQ